MKILFDETYTSNDGKYTSRNIWYGYADISVEDQHGKTIKLNEDFMVQLCELIKNDLSKNAANVPTQLTGISMEVL